MPKAPAAATEGLRVSVALQGAEAGQSSPDVVPAAPPPVDGEQHGGNDGQFAEKDWMDGHGSNGEGGQQKPEAAEKAVDDDF